MKVLFNPAQNCNNYNNNNAVSSPSFKMDMKELRGIDQFVAKKYEINPQKFKLLEHFYKKCKDMALAVSKSDFFGRQQATKIQRKAIIKEWYDYITNENTAYTGAIVLMIIKGITSGLKKDDDNLPPVLNKGVLADTLSEVQGILNKDPQRPLNFGKEYFINLQKSLMEEEKQLDETLSGWIVIPSKKHDSKNFEKNVDKLKMLSHNNWCTKSFNAEPYLAMGDFHVYLEKGRPKLGVRFERRRIAEVQGELNNSKIPLSYSDIVMPYIKKYMLSSNAREEVKTVKQIKSMTKKINKILSDETDNNSTKKILELFGIKCKKDKDGLLIISEYKQPGGSYTYSDLGVDETNLFKDIKIIKGYANFSSSNAKNLGSLQVIRGDVQFDDNKILKEQGLKCLLRHKFPNGIENASTQEIFEKFGIKYKKDKDGLLIISAYDLPAMYGFCDLGIDENKLLKDIKRIESYADFTQSNATSLGSLQSIDGEIYFANNDSELRQEWLKYMVSSKFPAGIENASTQEILEEFGIKCKKDKDGLLIISEYRQPWGYCTYADLGVDENKLLRDIKIIQGDAQFWGSSAKDLGNIQHIGGCALFSQSKIENLNKLSSVGTMDCSYSKITSLGDVEEVRGDLVLCNSMVKNLGKLRKVRGDVYITKSAINADKLLSQVRVRRKIYDKN